ncbi:phosphotransferase [Candidatus Poribacteria bacterium]|jgi:aminoglycoside phosphotransferase (APT) family kinase protein|nr:phosphotransferase [Candidatus Poribacteria bacterium]MBT5714001.1 phosphotransferase [Candidatus Poribacteria bacterium]MBT7100141.1 phosphotransferase [Candidatus Poribacteria bacterium]MBT7804381.1 phosphotransferase [Candidatus Poribacteria bacterium]
MTEHPLPSDDVISQLLGALGYPADGATVVPAPGDHYNAAYVISVRAGGDAVTRLVLKTYENPDLDREAKARREFRALQMLREADVPTPEPIWLDDRGALLGAPAIASGFIDGVEPNCDEDAVAYATAAAAMLARIHRTAICDSDMPILMDGNAECVWFLKAGVPDYMHTHPHGELLWHAIADMHAQTTSTSRALLHTDFWTGNVLWDGRDIVAVLDWEEAAYGDPAIDVAYCRMDMHLNGMGSAIADQFLRRYEEAAGRPVEHLALWELAAAVRPMHDGEWEHECRDELLGFIADARRRAGI